MRNQQRQKAQQRPFDAKLIAKLLAAVGLLGLFEAVGSLRVPGLIRGDMLRQCQPPALQRQQIFFRTKILRTAKKLNIKDDVFVFHRAAFGLAYRVKGARRQHKDVPALCRTDLRTGLHKAAAAFYICLLYTSTKHSRSAP